MSERERFHVITGGPGSGKTSLIEALARAGHAHTVEAGRAIIQDQLAIDGPALPWRDPLAFAELMLSWEMRSYRMAETTAGPVFFDRGVTDLVGYLTLVGQPMLAHIARAAERFRYDHRVFVAPPWPAIYAQDTERKQTPEEAVRTYEALVTAYSNCGYELVSLPLVSVEERVRFVLDDIGA
ncbi:MAG: AAA family ATPase [Rhodospirillales bacterium]|nr:AAA family ATPase [Rhodospirillales bacterium]